MISTRGRYALRVMADIAEHTDKKYVPMKEVAQRQGISLKYLERILPVLTQNGFLEGLQGKGGGYRLVKPPEECRIGDILRLTEGDLAPVAGISNTAIADNLTDICTIKQSDMPKFKTIIKILVIRSR